MIHPGFTMVSAIVVFAFGMLTLAWCPRPDEIVVGRVTHGTYPQAVAFVAMWEAVIVGVIERGFFAFPLVVIVGFGIAYLASFTLPRRFIAIAYVLSIIGGIALAVMIIATAAAWLGIAPVLGF